MITLNNNFLLLYKKLAVTIIRKYIIYLLPGTWITSAFVDYKVIAKFVLSHNQSFFFFMDHICFLFY